MQIGSTIRTANALEDARLSKVLAPLQYVLAYQNAQKKPSYPNFLKQIGLDRDPDREILGEPLFGEQTKKASPQRPPKPVEVEGDWGDGETVVDLIANKAARESDLKRDGK